MKEIFVYVEGPSDQLGMRELFSDIIDQAKGKGDAIDFFPTNGKEPLLNNGPKRAINILRNRPNSYVFLLPDLYPPNKPFSHINFSELKTELSKRFDEERKRKGCDHRLTDRFFIHCFKYDLEALLLASERATLSRLKKTNFSQSWTKPVENQNHNHPPKRVVEALFHDAGMKYKDTVDVPWILKRSSHIELSHKCPQHFKLFVDDLLRILDWQIDSATLHI